MFETLRLENIGLVFVVFPVITSGPSSNYFVSLQRVSKVFFNHSVFFLSIKNRIMRFVPVNVLTQCV